jgi:hypothetical protein
MERSFANYLIEPQNETWMYYLMESLRRKMYLLDDFGEKPFLSGSYKKYFKESEGILHNLHYVVRDSTLYANIKATALLNNDSIEFETNLQAFEYFSKIFSKARMPEITLTLALYETKNKSRREELLTKYILMPDALYKEYAEQLRSNTLYAALKNNTRQLFIIDDLTFWEDHFYGYHNRLIKSEEKMPGYVSKLRDLLQNKFPGKDVRTMEDLRNTELANEDLYRQTVNSTALIYSGSDNESGNQEGETYTFENNDDNSVTQSPENVQQQLFVFNPRLWYVLKNNHLRSIEYLNAKAFDDVTQLTGVLNLLNPFYYLTITTRFAIGYIFGSARFTFDISYCKYDAAADDKEYLYHSSTSYKMTQYQFLNAVYYALLSDK